MLPLVVGCEGPCPSGSTGAAACAQDTAVAAPDAVPDTWPAAPATWGPAEVPAGIEAALGSGIAEPWGTVLAWLGLFDHADASCPNGDAWNLPIDYAGCETSDGWHFAGTAELLRFDGTGVTGFQLSNDCEVIEPDGTRYFGDGQLSMEAPTGSGRFWVNGSGTFAWPSAGGLLGSGHSMMLHMEGGLRAEGGTLAVDGISAVAGAAVSFEGVAVDTESCAGGTGTIGLRDPSGGWHALVLDAACDGCGTVSYDGTETGRACVDLAPMWAASLAALRPPADTW